MAVVLAAAVLMCTAVVVAVVVAAAAAAVVACTAAAAAAASEPQPKRQSRRSWPRGSLPSMATRAAWHARQLQAPATARPLPATVRRLPAAALRQRQATMTTLRSSALEPPMSATRKAQRARWISMVIRCDAVTHAGDGACWAGWVRAHNGACGWTVCTVCVVWADERATAVCVLCVCRAVDGARSAPKQNCVRNLKR